MKAEKLLEVRFPAKPERLCLVRSLVRSASTHSGCSGALCDKLVIAVNEACMNVIQHAYKGDESGEMVLEILNNGSELLFRLKDHAAPIDLNSVKPRDLDEIRPGGLGVHFIREIMDECRMGHLEKGAGNYLEMTKRID
ncbi:MAG: ATP-binding protein [Gammaproteobacteria bacterium]|nr:ATP-binding protein [Gammaproteobacteria bacterium]